MKTTKIIIKNMFGIKELQLDGKSIEAVGTNGTGKTSIIDAIRYALTNSSDRDYIIKNGETEGEILIETDTGLSITRKKRTEQTDYKSIKENGKDVPKAESFLRELFTPMQLNPVEFTKMSRQEQNRIILDLIEFDWNLQWIKEKFGEIPPGVNYDQNILQVLAEIQDEKGYYFTTRQDINRDARNKQAFIYDIAKDIPEGYQFDKWNNFDTGSQYRELERIKAENNKIERAKVFTANVNNKLRGLQADKEIATADENGKIATERNNLDLTMERLRGEIKAAEIAKAGLHAKLSDKLKVISAEFETAVTKLNADAGVALEYSEKEPQDTTVLNDEINNAEAMKKHLNEYKRMIDMQNEMDDLKARSEELTAKIELARELPAEILKNATIPVLGLTVENGIPLINGLPVSNLSEGEKLDLCVDVAISKPNSWQIILLDGTEKLSDENRMRLYNKCKEKGLQFIASRTTNQNEMEVTQL